ncbi:hypothetical protein HK101_008964 [Irineochytrium annulatum]|nr:hypothetical protein HK101_008964 [Irineochytrium annulatum]
MPDQCDLPPNETAAADVGGIGADVVALADSGYASRFTVSASRRSAYLDVGRLEYESTPPPPPESSSPDSAPIIDNFPSTRLSPPPPPSFRRPRSASASNPPLPRRAWGDTDDGRDVDALVRHGELTVLDFSTGRASTNARWSWHCGTTTMASTTGADACDGGPVDEVNGELVDEGDLGDVREGAKDGAKDGAEGAVLRNHQVHFRHQRCPLPPSTVAVPVPPTAAMATTCFVLSANSICGSAFAGYPVLLHQSASPAVPSVVDEDSFNQFITFEATGAYSTFVAGTAGCDEPQLSQAIDNARYRMTFYCAFVVYNSLRNPDPSCTPAGVVPSGPVLCGSVCDPLAALYNSALTNPSICPATTDAAATNVRNSLLHTFGDGGFCSTEASFVGQGNQCITSVPNDVATCGFASDVIAAAQCPGLMATDACCKQFVGTTTTTTSAAITSVASSGIVSSNAASSTARGSGSVTVLATTGPATATNGTLASSAGSSSSASTSSLLIPIVVAVSVAVVIIILVTVLFVTRRRIAAAKRYDNGLESRGLVAPHHYHTTAQHSPPRSPQSAGTAGTAGATAYQQPEPAFYQNTTPGTNFQSSPNSPFGSAVASPAPAASPFTPTFHNFPSEYNAPGPHEPVPIVPAAAMLASNRSSDGGGMPSPVAGTPVSTVPPAAALASAASANPLVMTITHPYAPTLADELELVLGQEIVVLKAFDDGWGLGLIPSTGAQGAFPLVCVGAAGANGSADGSEAGGGETPVGSEQMARLSAMMGSRDAAVNRMSKMGKRVSSIVVM